MATQPSLKDYIGIVSDSGLAYVEFVEQGLPVENLELLKAKGLTFTEMGQVISPRTLKHRKARGENLSPVETETAIRVASTIRLAEEVFGNSETALRWLRERDDRLGDRTPLSLLHTEAGGRQVAAMLHGIAHGIFS